MPAVIYEPAITINQLSQNLLDEDNKLLTSLLPPLSISSVVIVANIEERDALIVQTGDCCKTLDDNVFYIYTGTEWLEFASGSASVAALTDVTLSAPTTGQTLQYNSTTHRWSNATPNPGVTDHTQLTNKGTNTHAQIDTFITNTNTALNGLGQLLQGVDARVDTTNTVVAGHTTSIGTLTTFKTNLEEFTIPRIDYINYTLCGDLQTQITNNHNATGTVLVDHGSRIFAIENNNALSDLSNITITNPSQGQALTYNSSAAKWVNSVVSSGGISDHTLLSNMHRLTQH